MALRIISTRLGELGAIYEPQEGINVAALIAGGFLEDTTDTPKSAKNKKKAPDAAETHQE